MTGLSQKMRRCRPARRGAFPKVAIRAIKANMPFSVIEES